MDGERFDNWKLCFFLGIALVVRLVLGSMVAGYPPDMGCFSGWSEHVVRVGFSRFYSGELFADYPPGYIYVLFLLGVLRRAFQVPLDSGTYLALLKMPAFLADILLAVFLYRAGRARLGAQGSFLLALGFAFNPAVMLNSALWGQIDSFFLLPLAMGVFLLAEGRVEWATFFWTLSFLIKPQALFLSPLWILAFLSRKDLWSFWRSVLIGFATFFLLSLPFSGLGTVFRLYRGTIGSYQYASLNAFNLLALLGGNWVAEEQKVLLLSYAHWGYVGLGVAVFLAVVFFFRLQGQGKFFLLASFLSLSVFFLAPRMHERYLFPVLFFLLLSYLFEPRRELLVLYAGVSGTFFVNVGLVLFSVFLYQIYHISRFDPWLFSVSALNGVWWGWMLWWGITQVHREGQRA